MAVHITNVPDIDIKILQKKLNSICADVSLCLPLPSENPTHSFVPGQSVLIKSLKPTKVGEPRYLGPATVIAVTRTGVLTDYQPQWIHNLERGFPLLYNREEEVLIKLRRELPLIVRWGLSKAKKIGGPLSQNSANSLHHPVTSTG
uniref:Uncharacterized protein n=1 Tax=Cyprinus carpio carpio TaxID=630221 RepID=A0A8C1B1D4_CYPCA